MNHVLTHLLHGKPLYFPYTPRTHIHGDTHKDGRFPKGEGGVGAGGDRKGEQVWTWDDGGEERVMTSAKERCEGDTVVSEAEEMV